MSDLLKKGNDVEPASINPLPPANFVPAISPTNELKPFRVWCQKVLPLVYGDELSYYELLCNVVDYLNTTMENVDIMEGDFVKLHAAFVQLQKYVNTYFSSLDVQQEINNKLDALVEDGTMSSLVSALYGDVTFPKFVDSVEQMVNKKIVYVLKSTGYIYFWNGSVWQSSGIQYGVTNQAILSSNTSAVSSANYQEFFTNADDIPINSVYLISSNITAEMVANLPMYGYITIMLSYSANTSYQYGRTQMAMVYNNQTTENKGLFYRVKTSSAGWSEWKSLYYTPGEEVFKSSQISFLTDGSRFNSADNLDVNTMYLITSTVTPQQIANLPDYKNIKFIYTQTYNTESEYGMVQKCIAYSNDSGAITGVWYRVRSYPSKWNGWFDMLRSPFSLGDSNVTQVSPNNYQDLGITDLNTLPMNKVYLLSGLLTGDMVKNIPDYGWHISIFTVGTGLSFDYGRMQFAAGTGRESHQVKHVWIRTQYYSPDTAHNNWSPWIDLLDTQGLKPSKINQISTTFTEFNDVNDMPTQVIYLYARQLRESNMKNLPLYGYNYLMYALDQNPSATYGDLDVAVGNINNQITTLFYRAKFYKVGWAEWLSLYNILGVKPKKIGVLGDSFSILGADSSTSWVNYAEQICGIKMMNHSVSGSPMSTTTVSGIATFSDTVQGVTDTGIDGWVLFGGLNDYRKVDSEMGTIEDTPQANSTFYASVKWIVEYIFTTWKEAKVLGVIPPKVPNVKGQELRAANLPAICNALREIYEYYSIPYVDMEKDCTALNVYSGNIDIYRNSDKFHPSLKGRQAMATVMEKGILVNM